MFPLQTPVSLSCMAAQIAEWNARIVAAIPALPPALEKLDPHMVHYLSGRKQVFNDFRLAAEKVAFSIRQSGILLLFQLEPEVRRLGWLTLHEVEELLPVVNELAKEIPEAAAVLDPLRITLEQVRLEMKTAIPGGEWGSETGAESSSFADLSQTERNG